jgi:hypothetical protein
MGPISKEYDLKDITNPNERKNVVLQTKPIFRKVTNQLSLGVVQQSLNAHSP